MSDACSLWAANDAVRNQSLLLLIRDESLDEGADQVEIVRIWFPADDYQLTTPDRWREHDQWREWIADPATFVAQRQRGTIRKIEPSELARLALERT